MSSAFKIFFIFHFYIFIRDPLKSRTKTTPRLYHCTSICCVSEILVSGVIPPRLDQKTARSTSWAAGRGRRICKYSSSVFGRGGRSSTSLRVASCPSCLVLTCMSWCRRARREIAPVNPSTTGCGTRWCHVPRTFSSLAEERSFSRSGSV